MAQEFDGPVVVKGLLDVKSQGSTPSNVKVDGNIFAFGVIEAGSGFGKASCNELFVNGLVQVRGDIEVQGTDLSPPTRGDVRVNGKITTLGDIEVGNDLRVNNISTLGNVNVSNVNVKGDIRLENADCAEEFEVDATCVQHLASGMVVVLGDEGCVRHSSSAYDTRVAGVVSGGGTISPGLSWIKETLVVADWLSP